MTKYRIKQIGPHHRDFVPQKRYWFFFIPFWEYIGTGCKYGVTKEEAIQKINAYKRYELNDKTLRDERRGFPKYQAVE